MYQLRCAIWLPLTEFTTFAFFEDAHNLPRITPAWLGFKVLTPTIHLQPGCIIDYNIRWAGLPMKWRTLIDEYDPPHRFVDTALKSPYKLWHHLHTFRPHTRDNRPGTLVEDLVTYDIGYGPLGPLAQRLIVRRQLTQIFEFRQKMIAHYLLGDRAADAVVTTPVHFTAVRTAPPALKTRTGQPLPS